MNVATHGKSVECIDIATAERDLGTEAGNCVRCDCDEEEVSSRSLTHEDTVINVGMIG